MPHWRQKVIDAGMRRFHASGAHGLAAPFARGQGAILTFEQVRPGADREFAPDGGLEIALLHPGATRAPHRAGGG